MRFYKFLVAFLLLLHVLIICSNSVGQTQPSYTLLQKKDGLQSNKIYNLHTAQNGLLYIAHSKGLSSFDGNAFKNYYNTRFPFTEVTTIMELDNGEIYCKAFNNVIYNIVGDSLVRSHWVGNSAGFTPSSAYKNTIISAGNNEIVFFDAVKKSTTTKAIPKGFSQLPDGKITFVTLTTVDKKNYIVCVDTHFDIFKIAIVNPSYVGQIHFDNNRVFFSESKNINSFFELSKAHKTILESAEKVDVNFIASYDSTICFCTHKGIYIAHGKAQNYTHLLEAYNVTDIAKTHDDNYFISTLEDGLIQVSNFKVSQFSNLPRNIELLCSNNNHIEFCTKNKGHYKLINNNNTYLAQLINNKAIYAFNEIFFFKALNETRLQYKNTSPNQVGKLNAMPIIKDYTTIDEAILFSTQNGLYLYSEKPITHWIKKHIDPAVYLGKNIHKLNIYNEFVPSVKYDNLKDRLIINTYKGLFELKENYNTGRQLPDPVNCNVKDIAVWEGELLLATTNSGIVIWNDTAYNYQQHKFPTNGILTHFYTYKNELWVQGESMLSCFSPLGLKTYSTKDGIPTSEVQNILIADDIIYVNTGDAILSFPKHLSTHKALEPKLILNSVVNANKPFDNGASFNYKNNALSIYFSLIAYNSNHIHLAYTVNNQPLIHLDPKVREIHLSNLSPDNYTIRYFVVDNATRIDTHMCTSFIINPPFYKTNVFIVILLFLSLSFAFAISRYILNNYKKNALHKEAQLLLEKELDKSMLVGIKAQMNPHFIFNALNTIQSYIYSNDKLNASRYISKFSSLTRNILEMSNKETVNINEEVNALKLYLELEKMRFEDTLDYQVTVDESLKNEIIQMPSMLVQPYVENAIKHGLLHKKTNRILKINFMRENNHLKISIDDNGVGRIKSAALNKIKNNNHQSFAMNANKKRLEILKNNFNSVDFEIIDKYTDLGEPAGTLVVIILPISA